MTESFDAANRQTHRWEKKFSIAQGYRLLSTDEVAIARRCRWRRSRFAAVQALCGFEDDTIAGRTGV